MRRSLVFVLVATVALAAWSYRWSAMPPVVAAASLPATAGTAPPAASVSQRARPVRWPEVEVAAAAGDPFSVAPAPQQTPPNLPPPSPPPVPAAALPPAAPALEHRFFGRVVSPDGQQITLLTRTGVPVAVSEGVPLNDGYVVESVRPEAVRLVYPPLGTVVDLPIPASPSEPR